MAVIASRELSHCCECDASLCIRHVAKGDEQLAQWLLSRFLLFFRALFLSFLCLLLFGGGATMAKARVESTETKEKDKSGLVDHFRFKDYDVFFGILGVEQNQTRDKKKDSRESRFVDQSSASSYLTCFCNTSNPPAIDFNTRIRVMTTYSFAIFAFNAVRAITRDRSNLSVRMGWFAGYLTPSISRSPTLNFIARRRLGLSPDLCTTMFGLQKENNQ